MTHTADSYRQHRLVGHSADIDSGGFQSFIGGDVTFDFPAAATAIAVASGSTADKGTPTAGTGARTIRVTGLDANYLEVSEDFTLNGQTEVVGTTEFLRITSVEVLTAGSGGSNAGIIYVGDDTATFTLGVPDVMYAHCEIGYNRDTDGQWTTPASTQAVLHRLSFSAFNATAKVANCRIETRDTTGTNLWVVRAEVNASDASVRLEDMIVLTEKTDIRLRVNSSSDNTEVSAVALLSVYEGERWEQG